MPTMTYLGAQDGNRQKMVKKRNSEEATMLQHRLDDMNQRLNDLKLNLQHPVSDVSGKITGGRIFMILHIRREQEALPVSSAIVSCSICKFAYHILNLIMLTLLPVSASS